MEKLKSTVDLNDVYFPKLARCRPQKLNVERFASGSGEALESKIDDNISLSVQEAEHGVKLAAGVSKLRIVIVIEYNGEWREKSTKNLVLKFSGEYEGIFNFPPSAQPEDVKAFVDYKTYRDILIAQAFPLARSHMMSTIQSMGVSSKRQVGFDLHNKKEMVEEQI